MKSCRLQGKGTLLLSTFQKILIRNGWITQGKCLGLILFLPLASCLPIFFLIFWIFLRKRRRVKISNPILLLKEGRTVLFTDKAIWSTLLRKSSFVCFLTQSITKKKTKPKMVLHWLIKMSLQKELLQKRRTRPWLTLMPRLMKTIIFFRLQKIMTTLYLRPMLTGVIRSIFFLALTLHRILAFPSIISSATG